MQIRSGIQSMKLECENIFKVRLYGQTLTNPLWIENPQVELNELQQ